MDIKIKGKMKFTTNQLSVMIIILILICSAIMGYMAFLIKTEGAICTNNPKAYLENKLEEKYNEEFICECLPAAKSNPYQTHNYNLAQPE